MTLTKTDTARAIRIGDKWVGEGHPVFVIAEIGINHNGSLELAKRMIDGAVLAGADAVKFQKRTPELCVPRDQWTIERDTPWGRHDLPRVPPPGRVRPPSSTWPSTATAGSAASCGSPRCWDEESVRLHRRLRTALLQGGLASLTDHELLQGDEGHRPPADHLDRHVDHGGDRSGGRGHRHRQPADRPRHLGLPLPGRGPEPAHDWTR